MKTSRAPRARKRAPSAIQSRFNHPTIQASAPAQLPASGGMPPEEIEYRTLLQEAILWASKQVLDEQRADILKRAEARVRTLQELRG